MKNRIKWIIPLLALTMLAGCQRSNPWPDVTQRPDYWDQGILQTGPTVPVSTGNMIDIPTLPTVSGQTFPTESKNPVSRPSTRPATQAPTGPAVPPDIGQGGDGRLTYTKYGRFTGLFPEDGKDDYVDGIAAVFVTNISNEYLDYADVRFNVGEKEATFVITGLQPGASTWAVEKNRLEIAKDATMTLTSEDLTFAPDNQNEALDVHVTLESGYLKVYNNTGRKLKNLYVYYKQNYSEDSHLGADRQLSQRRNQTSHSNTLYSRRMPGRPDHLGLRRNTYCEKKCDRKSFSCRNLCRADFWHDPHRRAEQPAA